MLGTELPGSWKQNYRGWSRLYHMPPTITGKRTRGAPAPPDGALLPAQQGTPLAPVERWYSNEENSLPREDCKVNIPSDACKLNAIPGTIPKDHFRAELIQKVVLEGSGNRGTTRGGPSLPKGSGHTSPTSTGAADPGHRPHHRAGPDWAGPVHIRSA